MSTDKQWRLLLSDGFGSIGAEYRKRIAALRAPRVGREVGRVAVSPTLTLPTYKITTLEAFEFWHSAFFRSGLSELIREDALQRARDIKAPQRSRAKSLRLSQAFEFTSWPGLVKPGPSNPSVRGRMERWVGRDEIRQTLLQDAGRSASNASTHSLGNDHGRLIRAAGNTIIFLHTLFREMERRESGVDIRSKEDAVSKDVLDIIGESIVEAPAVFGRAAGQVAAEVGNVAGAAGGAALSGFARNLALPGLLAIAAVAVVVFATR